jgi:AcrR family transcriptional regulator
MRSMDEQTLEEQRREITEKHLIRAARSVVAEKGLATRMEDVAAAAGVSRRTVFRYFRTRDKILIAALETGMRSYHERLPRRDPDGDPAAWLEAAMIGIHRMNAQHGRLYWEIALGNDLPSSLAATRTKRHEGRLWLVRWFSGEAWKAFGGEGKPPSWLVDACAVQLSAFATQALVIDFRRTPEQSGRLAAKVLRALIAEGLRERTGPAARGRR